MYNAIEQLWKRNSAVMLNAKRSRGLSFLLLEWIEEGDDKQTWKLCGHPPGARWHVSEKDLRFLRIQKWRHCGYCRINLGA
jgi:hypothetical protein